MARMDTKRRGRKVALLTASAVLVLTCATAWFYRSELRTWYLFWEEFENLGKNTQSYSYPEYRHRKTGIVFVLLPGGEFYIGTSREDGERFRLTEEELGREQQHKVTLRPFLMAKYCYRAD